MEDIFVNIFINHVKVSVKVESFTLVLYIPETILQWKWKLGQHLTILLFCRQPTTKDDEQNNIPIGKKVSELRQSLKP